MRTPNVCHLMLFAAFALPSAVSVQAKVGCVLLEPATRHTNGIPMARSEPRRTTSVTWQCNPENLGYCGCHYYWPCCESLRPRNVWDAAHARYTPREFRSYKSYAGCVCPAGVECSGIDGIEPPGMVQLGQVSNTLVTPGLGGPGVGGPGVPLPSPGRFPASR